MARRPRLPDVKYSFHCELTTRFADEDNQKILNHATYMPLMEEGRHLYFIACGLIASDSSDPIPCVQHSTHVRFVAPGKGPATVMLEVSTIHLGKTSFTQAYKCIEKSTGKIWVECIQTLTLSSYTAQSLTLADGAFASVPLSNTFKQTIISWERDNGGRDLTVPADPTTGADMATLFKILNVERHPGPFRFQLPVKTRWVDEDRHGTLSGSVYWTLMEDGRAAYFGDKGLSLMADGNAFPFVLLCSTMRYFKPGKGAQNGIVDVRTIELGGSSFIQHYRVRHETGTVWCEAVQVFVMWDVAKKCKMDMPETFRQKTAEFDGLPPPPPLPAAIAVVRKDKTVLHVGDRASLSKTFGQKDLVGFAQLSEDYNRLHLDPAFAATTQFKKPIVHGALLASLFSGILGSSLPGGGTVYMSQKSTFKKPVFANQLITANVEIVNIRSDKPIVTLRTWIEDAQSKAELLGGEAVVMVPKTMVLLDAKSKL